MPAPEYEGKALSPMVPVSDMQRSIGFYTEVLGLEVAWHSESYSILSRGVASLHLSLVTEPAVFEMTRQHLSFYLEVEGIEQLWAHVSGFRERYKVRELFDRDYGMREFHIIDPDGCLVFVGERIARP